MKNFLTGILISGFLIGCKNGTETPKGQTQIPQADTEIPTLNYSVVKTFPHDTTAYTQGLLIYDKKIFESTGSPLALKYTRSVLGILDTVSGKINVKAELDREKYFGEGIVILKNKLYQLTWRNKVGFIYDAKTFKQLETFNLETKEGWGITTDGTYQIMSHGTNKLCYLDPSTLKVIKSIEVDYSNLNELEFIKGYIYANVYQKNFIVKIDTANGDVTGILDLSLLVDKAQQKSLRAEVLNGIAFDSLTNKLLVTGKLWPEIYQITLIP